MATGSGNKALLFIFITLLIDVIGLGIIIPVMPDLIISILHCSTPHASVISGWMMLAYSSMQFLFSPVLGGLSDRFGRRPILLCSLFAFGIDYFILGFANSIAFLFVGRFIAGVTGASFTTATAYIADISTPETRAKNFGMVGAAFGLGFIIGPAIGGMLGGLGLRVPFFAAAGLSFLNTIYGYFIVPESLKMENRRKFEWKRANPLGALLHLRRYPMLIGLAIAFLLMNLAGQSLPTTWAFFGKYQFKWSEGMIGVSLAVVGLSIALVQGGLNRIVIPKLGEKRSIYVGFCFYAIGMAACASSSATWMVFLALVPLALGGFAGPSMQSMMSSHVGANEQGELQGTLTSLMSVASIIGPLLFPFLFSYFTSDKAPLQLPGAAMFCSALLTLCALFTCVMVFRKRSFEAKHVAAGASLEK
ncbi:MAG TPA: TCR/Tet family MFS transporter [Bacteroidia bacterium]|jgi:DHA1 family tetracycline resistance protein-like MFS transporter|nr:TCR/Tet family MFS transporter [Bacteroidia bacterium]